MNEEYKQALEKWFEGLDEGEKTKVAIDCIIHLGYYGQISFGEIGEAPIWSGSGEKLSETETPEPTKTIPVPVFDYCPQCGRYLNEENSVEKYCTGCGQSYGYLIDEDDDNRLSIKFLTE